MRAPFLYRRTGVWTVRLATLVVLLGAWEIYADFSGVQIVPGRGPVSTAADVGAYRDMLVGIRAKVQALVAQKKTLAEVIAAKPSAPWDAKYARGGVSPDRFVESVYASLEH